MKCSCGKETVLIDYPESIRYHTEDTEWGCPPDNEDPGMLVAKINTQPSCDSLAEEYGL